MKYITKFDDKCIIVNIPIGKQQRNSLYEATRRCWRMNFKKAKKADYLLGTYAGEVICVIKIDKCNYTDIKICNKEKEKKCRDIFGVNIKLCEKQRRIAFDGKELKNDKKYLGKHLPKKYIPGQNPVRYTYE